MERKSTIFYKIEEMERPGSFQTAANWTRASPKAVLQFLPLDSTSTEQALVVFSQSFIVFFKMGGKGKEKDLFPSTWVGSGIFPLSGVGGTEGWACRKLVS